MSQPLSSLFVRAVQDRLEQVTSEDMRALARLYLRSRRLQQKIAELREAGARRCQHWTKALTGSLYLQQISAVLARRSSQRKQLCLSSGHGTILEGQNLPQTLPETDGVRDRCGGIPVL